MPESREGDAREIFDPSPMISPGSQPRARIPYLQTSRYCTRGTLYHLWDIRGGFAIRSVRRTRTSGKSGASEILGELYASEDRRHSGERLLHCQIWVHPQDLLR